MFLLNQIYPSYISDYFYQTKFIFYFICLCVVSVCVEIIRGLVTNNCFCSAARVEIIRGLVTNKCCLCVVSVRVEIIRELVADIGDCVASAQAEDS